MVCVGQLPRTCRVTGSLQMPDRTEPSGQVPTTCPRVTLRILKPWPRDFRLRSGRVELSSPKRQVRALTPHPHRSKRVGGNFSLCILQSSINPDHPQAWWGVPPPTPAGPLSQAGSSELLPADLAASICCHDNLLSTKAPLVGFHWVRCECFHVKSFILKNCTGL